MKKHLSLALLSSFVALAAPARVNLKFAVLAPEGSAWMQAFEAVRKEVDAASGGEVRVRAYPSGVMGSEKDVVFKMRVGQLDGAGFVGAGTSILCPDADALMVPMLFRDYAEVDAVLGKMTPALEAQALKNGYVLLGWTEIGFSHLYSLKPVQSLADLRKAKPWALPEDTITGELYKAAGVGGIPVQVGDVLVGLQTGLLETVFAPPLGAVSMQWHTRVKYLNTTRLVYSVGGVFVSAKSWEKIPAAMRPRVRDIFARHLAVLRDQVRKSNDEALQVLEKQGVKATVSTPEQLAEFERLRDAVVQGLQGKTFSPDAWAEVLKHLEACRAAAGKTP